MRRDPDPRLRRDGPPRAPVDEARERALTLLDRRMRSRREIESALRQRGFDAKIIDEVVESLTAAGHLDDRAFASAFARDRVRLAPRGYRLIARELAEKGVARDVVDEVLRQVEREFPEAEVARALLDRRSGRRLPVSSGEDAAAGDPDAEQRSAQRDRRWLEGKGFRRDTIARVARGSASWTR